MPPTSDPTEPRRLTPAQLIALNANLDLPRGAVCRLAFSDLPWWSDEGAEVEALLPELGVAKSTLTAARRTLREAEQLARGELRRAADLGVRIQTLHDDEYPPALRDLALPPPVLYLRGRLPVRPCLSIVGARKATAYGRDAAGAFASELAGRGLGIVSGFARGVDAAAHRAAAGAPGGVTLAVLGCGLDVDYPRGRAALRREICRRGGLLTEFPFGAAPIKHNFPIRNRLIAALGHGTLVVEATARSGSLITARLALELGREVYATPGRIFDAKAAGPNTLIRDGAFLVQHPDDVMITLPQGVLERLPTGSEPGCADPNPNLPRHQARILATLRPGEEVAQEMLASRVEMTTPELLTALLELELAGWVRRRPGPAYARCELW